MVSGREFIHGAASLDSRFFVARAPRPPSDPFPTSCTSHTYVQNSLDVGFDESYTATQNRCDHSWFWIVGTARDGPLPPRPLDALARGRPDAPPLTRQPGRVTGLRDGAGDRAPLCSGGGGAFYRRRSRMTNALPSRRQRGVREAAGAGRGRSPICCGKSAASRCSSRMAHPRPRSTSGRRRRSA